MVPSLPLLSCESSVSVRKTLIEKKKTIDTSLTKRYKRKIILSRYFWSRWRQEYIAELREFNKIKNRHGILVRPNVDDVALNEDEDFKKMDWRIRKVDILLCSEDGEVWSAEIIVIKNGRKLKWWWPINKLYPLECSAE